MRYSILSVVLCCTLFSGLSVAAGPEEGLARRIAAERDVGTPIWLEAGGARFLGLVMESRIRPVKGAVLLAHDRGAHPDWPQIVGPLRRALPTHGWLTLAVALPPLAGGHSVSYDRWLQEALGRLRAGFDELARREAGPVFLIGHGWGALPVAAYPASRPGAPPAGLVMVNPVMAGEGLAGFDLPGLIEKLRLPVLDIYGTRARRETVAGALERAQASSRGLNAGYRQLAVEGADHSFTGMEHSLAKRVRGWLDKTEVPQSAAP